MTISPLTRARSSGGQEHQRAEEGGEDAAPVDVADEQHRRVGEAGDLHIDDVVPREVQFDGAARALDDDEVVVAPQRREGFAHDVQESRAVAPVVARLERGERATHDDYLAARCPPPA